jgi:acyl-CoA reductase-like NAD-dependent aldehyde dehydrogenase
MVLALLVFMHLCGLSYVREEVFGPVAPILPFKTEDEAIRLANDTNAGSFSGHDLYFNASNSKDTKNPALFIGQLENHFRYMSA